MTNSDQSVAPIPGAKAALWLLLAINLFNYIDRQILSAVVPQIREEFFKHGADNGPVVNWLLSLLQGVLGSNPENAMIGLLAMAFMVTYMFAAPIFGWLRIPRWWIIAAGVLLWSLASGATGLATSFGLLLATRCFVGLGEAAYGPVAPAVLSDLYPLNVRGRILSLFYIAIPVGSALGFAFAGAIAASAWGWRWAFYLVVPPGVILSLLCLFMKEHKAASSTQAEESGSSWRDYGKFLRIPSYTLNVLGMAAMTFAIGGIGFWMPSYIHEYRGVQNLAQINIIFGAILVVAGLSATLFGGWLADRLRSRFKGAYLLMSGVSMIICFPCFLTVLWVPFPYAWIALFACCFCLFLNTGPSNTAVVNVIQPHLRSSAFALTIFITHALGDVISPLVIGAVTDAFGNNMDIAFVMVSLTVLFGGVLWVMASRYLDADTEKAERKE